MSKFNKSYETEAEIEMRFKNWQITDQYIKKHVT